jgi:PAS domain S-box-containing protein
METGRSRLLWNIAKLNSRFHTVILVCLVAIMCYESARLAYALRIPPDHIASFWPATPFLAAVLLLTPRRIWPALIAAGLGAMALADLENGVPIGSIMWFFLGDLAAVLGATLGMSRLFKGVPHLSSVKTLGKYLAVAVILAPFASGFLGATGKVPGGYWLQWRLWFFSDALAFLTVTPAILNWAREGRAWARKSGNYLELAALMTSLVFFGYLAFMSTGRSEPPALLYSLVPLLLWAALRLGLKGVSTSIVVITYLSIWGASHGRGPFTAQGPLNNVLSLQLFLFFAAIPFMFLAVLVEGQKRAQQALINEEARLRESEERFRLAAQAGQMYAFEWDVATDKVMRSEEYVNVLGFNDQAKQLTRQQVLASVHADDRALFVGFVDQVTPENPTTRFSYRVLRPDGSVVWLEKNARAFFDEQGRMLRIIGMVADVTERKRVEEVLSYMSRTVIEAEERERNRIARDLHEDIGQRLSLLAIGIEGLKDDLTDQTVQLLDRMDAVRKETLGILTDVKSTAHELHSPRLEYLGLAAVMRSFCKEFGERKRVEIDFKSNGLPSLVPPDISLCLFRVLQEALHNAMKHSGVRQFDVQLQGTPDEIHLTVSDSGAGFNLEAARKGRGLIRIEQRLKLVKGTFSIESQPKSGTTIHARVPLSSGSDASGQVEFAKKST